MDANTVSTVLQFGFAGVLLVFVWLVNRQFMRLIDVVEKHLEGLIKMLESCMSSHVTLKD